MDATRTVQHNPTTAQRETFFSEGSQAWPSEPIADLPGVGATPINQLPSTLRGLDAQPGDFPQTLRAELDREERDRLLGQLLFAARNLASNFIQSMTIGSSESARGVRCRECFRAAFEGEVLRHSESCHTGHVNSLLARLAELHVPASISLDRPEPINLLCLYCGERGGDWRRGMRVEEGDAVILSTWQRIASDGVSGRFVWTHDCLVSNASAQTGGRK